MNPIYKTHLTNDSIKSIAQKFFSEYKDPKTRAIDAKGADIIVKDTYECMGVQDMKVNEQGKHLLQLFASNGNSISYDDIEKTFTRYLTDYHYVKRMKKSSEKGVRRRYLDTSQDNEQKRAFYKAYDTMVKQHGREIVDFNLDEANSLFKKYDANKDGYLDKHEVRQLVNDTYNFLQRNVSLSDEDLDRYIEFMDIDKDGHVSECDYDLYTLKSLQNRNISI